ncbi:class I SAM-dependent methyltransferase [Pseudogracilibacillus auburnensis]|nr:class I SAM-dependent methyltransferase [Pseudogracilibacillus auburnensis]
MQVTGIDFSPKMLGKAYEKIGKSQSMIILREMDAQRIEFSK